MLDFMNFVEMIKSIFLSKSRMKVKIESMNILQLFPFIHLVRNVVCKKKGIYFHF